MGNSKAIRKKIASVSSTRKITSAMEMVAASKMRRAQEQMEMARPYADTIWEIVCDLISANPEYKPLYLWPHPAKSVKRVGFLVISSEKGLCGGLNINLFKEVILKMRVEESSGAEPVINCIGAKGTSFFRSMNMHPHAITTGASGERATPEELMGVCQAVYDELAQGKMRKLYLCYNKFVNTMTQEPLVIDFLPPPRADIEEKTKDTANWDYIYEPEPHVLLDKLVQGYMESTVFRAVAENFACEQAAKMIAMKNATDNAGDLINDLQLEYNNARQASITQELSEIIGGAEAI